jgi:bacterioferritin
MSPRGEEPAMKFTTDIRTLRIRARNQFAQEALTPCDDAKAGAVIPLLNEALAWEIMCVQRYQRHYSLAAEISSESVKAEFLQHANEEQTHADHIAHRIIELGGDPHLSRDGPLGPRGFEYVDGQSVTDMITEDLIAERIAIDSYQQIIMSLGNDDPTTKRLLEDILATEEEHAQDLASLLNRSTNLGTKARSASIEGVDGNA